MSDGKVIRLSKAEKRLAKRTAKEIKRKLPDGGEAKLIAQIQSPDTTKVVAVAKPTDLLDQTMCWTRAYHDCDGEWSWGVDRECGAQIWTDLLAPKLDGWKGQTWRVIQAERTNNRQKHVYYDVYRICEEAFDRLFHLKMDDQDSIFRFRLGGKRRLYGFVFNGEFRTLWYDPSHDIYPTEPGGLTALQKKQKKKVLKERAKKHGDRKAARLRENAVRG